MGRRKRFLTPFSKEARKGARQVAKKKRTGKKASRSFRRSARGAASSGARPIRVGRSVKGSILVSGDRNKINAAAREPGPDRAALRRAYLCRILEKAGRLPLTSIDPKAIDDAKAGVELQAIYTSLMTLSAEDPVRGPGSEAERRIAMAERRRRSAVELLDAEPRLVLLGEPGSGKSTFVNFAALCLAGEALKDPAVNLKALTAPLEADDGDGVTDKKPRRQPWRHRALLPLRIVLRDFAARGLPGPGQQATAEDLWRFIAGELKAASLADFEPGLREELHEKGGMVFLDGLDEVPEAERRREQILQAIGDFTAVHERCRFLVTCRTYAYQKPDWRLGGFESAVLAPFSDGQIRRFIERWYAHIGPRRGLGEADARGRAEVLKRAVSGSERLLDLARRPLLLTLMASLHAWRGGTLPDRREELYADCVKLLLESWESQRVVYGDDGKPCVIQPSLSEWLKVDRERVLDLLSELALAAHERQPALADAADIPEGHLAAGLMRISRNNAADPNRLLEYLTDRSGILVARESGVYALPHRTFQEYLAACRLTDADDYPANVAGLVRADPNRWREVALLAAAKAARGQRSTLWSLVDELCPEPPGEDAAVPDTLWAAIVAGQAIEESADLERLSAATEKKLATARSWLVEVLRSNAIPAVDRARAGDSLGRIGDPRFREDAWGLPDEPLLGFVEIPEGKFWMGSDPKKDPGSSPDEHPQHPVVLKSYYIARYPVTVSQFRAFVDDAGFEPADRDCLNGLPNHPVVLVTWHEALAYCRWLEEKLRAWENTPEPIARLLQKPSHRLTLPSEAELEKAARGSDGRIFPWGDDADPEKANYDDTGIGRTSPVGCFHQGKSPHQVEDLAGNVWEWTRSIWGEDWGKPRFKYPYDAQDGRENCGAPDHMRRVLRGGAFDNVSWYCRCAVRYGSHPLDRDDSFGFRVALSPA
jgi:formylglycine-generating enzyme required for sulfatase activity